MENKEIKFNMAEIDQDVLEVIQKNDVEKILNDDKLYNRALLNAFAELLSEMKKLSQVQEELLTVISMLSNEKLQEFFYGVKENYEEAVKEQAKIVSIKEGKKKKNK